MTVSTLSPLMVVQAFVHPDEIARYYVEAELTRITGEVRLSALACSTLEALSIEELWRLTAGLSGTYRLNYVSEFLGNSGYSWSEEIWDPERLQVPKLAPHIDAIIQSSEIRSNLVNFARFLRQYFDANPSSDPENLDRFRPGSRATSFYRLAILRVVEDEVRIVDGTNRLVAQLMHGEPDVTAFVGRRNELQPALRADWNEFRDLRNRWRTAKDPEVKATLLAASRYLMETCHDGRYAVQIIWVAYGRYPEVIAAGQDLLDA